MSSIQTPKPKRQSSRQARFYGPAKCVVSDQVASHIDHLLTLRNGGAFDFTDWDEGPRNRTQLEYLFHTAQHPSRCFESSAWSKKVSQVFKQFSPRNCPTPPRLLRSAFVTALRSADDVPKAVLESAAHCMKHCLETASSDVYDLEVHKRLQKASFEWTEKFASDYEQRQGIAGEDDDVPEFMTSDGGASPDDAMEEEHAPSPMALTSRLVVPAATPMAAMKSARHALPKKRAAEDDGEARKRTHGADESFEIELITGATITGSDLTYRLLWRGHPDMLDWWESLEGPSFEGDDYVGRVVLVLKAGTAPKLSADGRQGQKSATKLVLGPCVEVGLHSKRVGHEPSGAAHTIDLASGRLDELAPSDWLMLLASGRGNLTDAVCDSWGSNQALLTAVDSWQEGAYFPAIGDAMSVLLACTISIEAAIEEASTRQAMVEVSLFIQTPSTEMLPQAKARAEQVRSRFVYGGLLYDCLAVIVGLEASCVKDMALLARVRAMKNPAAAAFDRAHTGGLL